MNHEKKKQISETFLLGAMLAIVGGFLDAYTYLFRGHVFANAQTGNIVLLGLSLAEKDALQALYYSFPILAFAGGILLSEWIRKCFRQSQYIHWRQIIVAAELAVLFLVAWIPQGKGDTIVNIAVSFICSMQVESFRKVNGNAVATTMCTGNLRSGTELLFQYMKTKEKNYLNRCLQYYGIILFFILGAILGNLFTKHFENYAVLFCCIFLLIPFGAMFLQKEKEK